jgi:DNA gyrase/topoisomerase IV subunit A
MKKKRQILSYLREITIVVIGIIIAVSIGNYKDRLDNKAYLNKTLKAIEVEMMASKTDVDTVLNRHLHLYNKLQNEFGTGEATLGEFLTNSGGFQVATVKNISLRFFISNKADLLEFDIISQLLEIESLTNILTLKIERITNFAYEHLNDTHEEMAIKFAYLLADIIESEQALLELYNDFLQQNRSVLNETNQ